MILATILAAFATPAPAPGGVVVFRGTPGTAGDVAVADPARVLPTVFPPELQGIELLAIDFNGRTEVERFLPDRPRLREDIPGASRLELPQGNGSLYRFSRDEGGGAKTYGILHVDANGDASSVWEMAGIGPSGADAPFKQRIAVAPAGDSILVATKKAAGGDALEILLANGAVRNRTSSIEPLSIGKAGLGLGDDMGVIGCLDRMLRFNRALSGNAQEVSLGLTGEIGGFLSWYSGDVVLSPGQDFAATTAGDGPTAAHVFVFGTSGGGAQVSKTKSELSGVGFLPDDPHGPYLAVNADGTLCAWRKEGNSREAFVSSVPAFGANPEQPKKITSDLRFLDTLDEIGQFMFAALGTTLRIAVGELDPGSGGFENIDFYEVEGAGALTVSNVTQSNGIASPPFSVTSTLKPEQTAWVPAAGGWIFYNDLSGGTGDVVSAEPSTPGMTVQVADLKEIDLIELVGSELIVVGQSSVGNEDREMWQVPASFAGSPSLVWTNPEAHTVTATAARDDGWFAFLDADGTKQRLWFHDTVSAAQRQYRRLGYGPTIGFAPTGELGFVLGKLGTPAIQAAIPPVGAPSRLKLSVVPAFVLP